LGGYDAPTVVGEDLAQAQNVVEEEAEENEDEEEEK
jgi:hypothetical protein